MSRVASVPEILERILDKGLVIMGDIKIRLVDIELLTLQIRLLIASVDKAREMGINWWETNPDFSTPARKEEHSTEELLSRIEKVEAAVAAPAGRTEAKK